MRRMITSVVVLVLLGCFTGAVAQLPPDIEADRELVRAERLISEEDPAGALEAMNRILALQTEHNLTLPEEFHFKYAEVALAARRVQDAVDSVNKYLVAVGREGSFYREALELLDSVEQIPDQACARQPEGADCWLELENQPECYVWNPFTNVTTATWTGACVGGLARGTGTLALFDRYGPTSEHTGRLQYGQRHGQWVERSAIGNVYEGPFVEGQRHGQWVERSANWGVSEGPYVDGQRHGQWVFRCAESVLSEGPYVDGKEHGRWVLRDANGDVAQGLYVDGQQHGRWVLRDANGTETVEQWVNGRFIN